MKKIDVIHALLGERLQHVPGIIKASTFAPTNIALCKYWGKRDIELNLPITSSLSISLDKKGVTTELSLLDASLDRIQVNGQAIALFSPFAKRLLEFLALFRGQNTWVLDINIQMNIPIAAGLASSAAGFAAFVMALNQLLDWELNAKALSILARLGSGSASRSIWQGFVMWEAGVMDDGMDSYGMIIPEIWPALKIGLLILDEHEKKISSRDAMLQTVQTSSLYSAWPEKVKNDLRILQQAIHEKDFHLLGKTAESNALAMHATMLSSWPPISFCLPDTLRMMQKVWDLRESGLPVYFTQDAGPNLKLLFLENHASEVQAAFPALEIISPFS